MKNLAFITLSLLLFISCSNDDLSNQDKIQGEWKLVEARFSGFNGVSTIDYSDQQIIYRFNQNGTLTVTGEENVGYSSGTYDYAFIERDLSTTDNPEVIFNFLQIGLSNWTYSFQNNQFVIGQSYVDGPDLIFKR